MHWRIKYWRWLNDFHGEWDRTGLMSKGNAEKLAEHLKQYHELVEIYYDDDSTQGVIKCQKYP